MKNFIVELGIMGAIGPIEYAKIKVKESLDSSKQKAEILFGDPNVVGKRLGYKKAVDEYRPFIKKLESEIKEFEATLDNDVSKLKEKAYSLLDELVLLEEKRKQLEITYEEKKKSIDRKIASLNTTGLSFARGITNGSDVLGKIDFSKIIDKIYGKKLKAVKEIEAAEYEKIKREFELVVEKTKEKLNSLKKGRDILTVEVINTMGKILVEIKKEKTDVSDLEVKIAELSLALEVL